MKERINDVGPYSLELQQKRRASLMLILKNPNLPEDMRRIWDQHLNNLALNETEYNQRVTWYYRDYPKEV